MDGNWLDIGVLVVIGGFFLIGLSSGLIFSAFRLFTIALSMLLSLSLYKRIADIIFGTYAETVIGTLVYDGFRSNPEVSAAQQALDVEGVLDGIASSLRLPRGMADAMFTKPESLSAVRPTSLFGEIDIIRHFSDQCTRAVISLFCIIVTFVALRVVISLVKIFLDELSAMKMFRLFNYIVGPALGLAEGVFTVYVALSVVMLVNVIVQNDFIWNLLSQSRLAQSLYENNLFLNFTLRRISF